MAGSGAAGSGKGSWLPVSLPPVTEMGRPGQGLRMARSQGPRGPPHLSPVMCSLRAKGASNRPEWAAGGSEMGRFLDRRRESPARGQCGPWQTCFPSLPRLDHSTTQSLFTENLLV